MIHAFVIFLLGATLAQAQPAPRYAELFRSADLIVMGRVVQPTGRTGETLTIAGQPHAEMRTVFLIETILEGSWPTDQLPLFTYLYPEPIKQERGCSFVNYQVGNGLYLMFLRRNGDRPVPVEGYCKLAESIIPVPRPGTQAVHPPRRPIATLRQQQSQP